jgi:3-methylcrotonyl-CoA carboxylase alpha subunit
LRALRCGDRRVETAVRQTAEGLEVTLAGRTFRFALDDEAPGVFVLREGSRRVRFHAARSGVAVHLFWDGVAYALAEEREGTSVSRRQDTGALEAPMPGRVTAVRAEAGQRVKRGEELLVVEAMKMENSLHAPRDGVVRAVHVSPGDMVAPGRPLVELEADR